MDVGCCECGVNPDGGGGVLGVNIVEDVVQASGTVVPRLHPLYTNRFGNFHRSTVTVVITVAIAVAIAIAVAVDVEVSPSELASDPPLVPAPLGRATCRVYDHDAASLQLLL